MQVELSAIVTLLNPPLLIFPIAITQVVYMVVNEQAESAKDHLLVEFGMLVMLAEKQ